MMCQNKISSEIFFNKEFKINFDQGFFCQASVNRSDSQIASQYLQNEACEQLFVIWSSQHDLGDKWLSYRCGRLNRFDCNSINPVETDINQSVLADIRLFLSLLKIMVKI